MLLVYRTVNFPVLKNLTGSKFLTFASDHTPHQTLRCSYGSQYSVHLSCHEHFKFVFSEPAFQSLSMGSYNQNAQLMLRSTWESTSLIAIDIHYLFEISNVKLHILNHSIIVLFKFLNVNWLIHKVNPYIEIFSVTQCFNLMLEKYKDRERFYKQTKTIYKGKKY